MWKLIEEKGLPMRQKRFCCSELKERGGEGRICVTGVRWAESVKRRNRQTFEIVTKKIKDKKLFNDNDEGRMMFENCMQKGKRVINPIIDWSDENVWGYIKSRGLKYCSLYDQGQKRLGCIGCPMGGSKGMKEDFARYPKFYGLYKRAAQKHLLYRRENGLKTYGNWDTPEHIMDWWIEQVRKEVEMDGQIEMDEQLFI